MIGSEEQARGLRRVGCDLHQPPVVKAELRLREDHNAALPLGQSGKTGQGSGVVLEHIAEG